jgi:oligopeptide transport system substrate-binding protein
MIRANHPALGVDASRKHVPKRLVAFVAIVATLPIASCSRCGSDGRPAESPPRKVLGIAIAEPETIDPSLASEEAGVTIARALFEGLLARPAGDGPMRPGVAESHEVSPDGRTWTFRLRADARWTDGKPVVAGDFEYAWRRVLDPATGSRSASLLYFLDQGREVHKGAAGPSALGVSAPDERTLVVRLRARIPDFEDIVTYPAWAPVRRDVVEAHGSRWTRPENMVSNGPFRLVAYSPGSRADLARNDSWWNARSVALDGVTFHFATSDRPAYDWFVAGRVQYLKVALARDAIPAMRRLRPADFHSDPILCTYYATLNVRKPPFDDVRVRRALDLAIDKERLVREVLMGGQAPAYGLVPPVIRGPTGYDPPQGAAFDPDRARALLDGHVREAGPLPPMTFAYNASEAHRLIAEFLQAEWKRNLGVDIRVEATEFKTLFARVHSGDYQIARASWCADFVDPGNFLEVLETGAASNYPGFSDSSYDAALAAARDAASGAERLAAYRRAEEILVSAVPILPLYFYNRIYLLSPEVAGFEPNLLDVHPLELMGLK